MSKSEENREEMGEIMSYKKNSKSNKKAEIVNYDRIIRCRVTVQRQFYPKAPGKITDGSFGIVAVKVNWVDETFTQPNLHPIYKTITIKGDSLPAMEAGDGKEYMVQAYETVSDYGTSYTVKMINEIVELKTSEQQRKFLSAILTERQVDNIFKVFDKPIDVIKERPNDLLKVPGIGETTLEKLLKRIVATEDLGDVFVELEHYKLTKREIDSLIVSFKNPQLVIKAMKKNPYVLMEHVSRVGFSRADEVALNAGWKKNSYERVRAFILYCLEQQAEAGNSWVWLNQIVQAIDDYFTGTQLSDDNISKALKSLVKDRKIWHNEDKTKIALTWIHQLESELAKEFLRLTGVNKHFNIKGWQEQIAIQEAKQGWSYTEEQMIAIQTILENNVTLVQGSAGTGKTSSVAGMLAVFKGQYQVAATALSGRAAVNISESASENGEQVLGQTIHRLLGVKGFEGGGFTHDKDNPLPYDIVILDEISMVDVKILLPLLQAIRTGAKLVMLGDNGQLPPIGVGNVMTDLIQSQVIPTAFLTTVHRQAAKSGIISESMKVRQGMDISPKTAPAIEVRGELQDLIMDTYPTSDPVFDRIMHHFKQEWQGLDDVMDISVVLPMRERGKSSVFHINNAIQHYLHQGSFVKPYTINQGQKNEFTICVGDKVIVNRNDYDVLTTDGEGTAIYNGNLGIVREIDSTRNRIVVEFKEQGLVVLEGSQIENLSLGYAMTVHKCVTGDTLVYTNKGIKRLEELSNGAGVGEHKPYEKTDEPLMVYNGSYLEAPSHFYNAGVSETRKIRTKTGYEIEGTLDHKAYVLGEDGRPTVKPFEELTTEDVLFINRSNQVYGTETKLPKWDEIKVSKRAKTYSIPTEMTEAFAIFLGLMVADGFLKQRGFALHKRYREVVETFQSVVCEVFGYEGSGIKSHASSADETRIGHYSFTVNSEQLRQFCSQIEGIQPHCKHVPQCILNAPKPYQIAFLKAVFEDGCVNIKRGKFEHIELSMKEELLCDQVRMMLLNFGILSSKGKYKGIYRISIYRPSALIFKQEIGFISHSKQARLDQYLSEEVKESPRHSIPNVPKVLKEIWLKYDLASVKEIHSSIKTQYNKAVLSNKITHQMLAKILKEITPYVDCLDGDVLYLNELAEEICTDKIAQIEAGEAQTYCLTMPETNTFVQNGMRLKNCQGSGFHTVIAGFTMESYVLLNRELVYTALTRAKKKCVVVAEKRALKTAASKSGIAEKQTFLGSILKQEQL